MSRQPRERFDGVYELFAGAAVDEMEPRERGGRQFQGVGCFVFQATIDPFVNSFPILIGFLADLVLELFHIFHPVIVPGRWYIPLKYPKA